MHTHKLEARAGDQSVVLTVVLAAAHPTADTMDVSLTLEIPILAAENLKSQLAHAIRDALAPLATQEQVDAALATTGKSRKN